MPPSPSSVMTVDQIFALSQWQNVFLLVTLPFPGYLVTVPKVKLFQGTHKTTAEDVGGQ